MKEKRNLCWFIEDCVLFVSPAVLLIFSVLHTQDLNVIYLFIPATFYMLIASYIMAHYPFREEDQLIQRYWDDYGEEWRYDDEGKFKKL